MSTGTYARYSFFGSSAGVTVTSVDGISGAITLVAGPGITIAPGSPTAQDITISSTAALTIGPLDSQPENANGLALVGSVLSSQSADGTHPGMVNITTQTFAGDKTFTGAITASNLSGTNTGDVTLTAVGSSPNADGSSLSGQVLTLQPANTSFPGVLTAADWNTFNGKQAAGNYITALTGDGTASGPGSAALTLATVNANVGSFTNASITVNAKGLITAASNGTGVGTVTSVSVVSANGFAGTVATATTTPAITLSTTITGILQGNGTAISAATTGNLTDAGTDGIVITGGTGAVLGSGTSIAQHVADTTHNGYLSSTDWNTFNGKGTGTVTSVAMTVPSFLSVSGSPITTSGTLAVTLSGTALPVANGGTSLTSLTTNNVILGAGTSAPTFVAPSTSGNVLTSNGTTWVSSTPSGTPIRSEIALSAGNGHGSTNNKVRRWTNTDLSTGTDVSYTDSATLGGFFTINTAGVYDVNYTDSSSAGIASGGIVVNGTLPTTVVQSLNYAQGLRRMMDTPATNKRGSTSWTGILAVNDIVWAQDDGNMDGSISAVGINITRVN